jgi:hypothetical protein
MVTVLAKKYDRYELSGLLEDLEGLSHIGSEEIGFGSIFSTEDTREDYILTGAGWLPKYLAVKVATLPGTVAADITAMKAKIDTMQADITLIKVQNQTAKSTSHSFVFGAAETEKTAAITYNGLNKHLHLVVPDFTNSVTATVTLEDASGRVFYTSAAKAKGESHNLEDILEEEWVEQLVDNTLIWKITLSEVPGGDGGTVVLVPRYHGV